MGKIKIEDSVLNYYNTLLTYPAFKSAIIAGGYIRDLYHGKYPSDVDIYIEYSKALEHKRESDLTEMFNVINDKNPRMTVIASKHTRKNSQYGGNDHLRGIMEFSFDSIHRPIQIMIVDILPEQYVLNHFNIGLSKCFLKGHKIRFLDGFLKDSQNNTFTIKGDLTYSQFVRTLEHYIPKIYHKYPFTTIISEDLEYFHNIYSSNTTI